MSFIILEGVDRSGKSTIAKEYEKKGYTVVHLSAPDKKYYENGYAGPSYMDYIVDLLMQYDGQDVVFDRSWYGELVWPHVYGRKSLLDDDDFEVIKEFEKNNNAKLILMIDKDQNAHWQRCVNNNEPITFQQFNTATKIYSSLAFKHGFIPMELSDDIKSSVNKIHVDSDGEQENLNKNRQDEDSLVSDKYISKRDHSLKDRKNAGKNDKSISSKTEKEINLKDEKEKLQYANAINSVLSKRIIKSQGDLYDALDKEIRLFLENKLSALFGAKNDQVFNDEEVKILKVFCERLKEKQQKG